MSSSGCRSATEVGYTVPVWRTDLARSRFPRRFVSNRVRPREHDGERKDPRIGKHGAPARRRAGRYPLLPENMTLDRSSRQLKYSPPDRALDRHRAGYNPFRPISVGAQSSEVRKYDQLLSALWPAQLFSLSFQITKTCPIDEDRRCVRCRQAHDSHRSNIATAVIAPAMAMYVAIKSQTSRA